MACIEGGLAGFPSASQVPGTDLQKRSIFRTHAKASGPLNAGELIVLKQAATAGSTVCPELKAFLHWDATAVLAGHGIVGVRIRELHIVGIEAQHVSGIAVKTTGAVQDVVVEVVVVLGKKNVVEGGKNEVVGKSVDEVVEEELLDTDIVVGVVWLLLVTIIKDEIDRLC